MLNILTEYTIQHPHVRCDNKHSLVQLNNLLLLVDRKLLVLLRGFGRLSLFLMSLRNVKRKVEKFILRGNYRTSFKD